MQARDWGQRLEQRWVVCADILIAEPFQAAMSTPQNTAWKTRLVEGGFPDRSFDIEFWQEQGDEAIFAAAWELVELAEEVKNGRKPTLQRTVTALKGLRSLAPDCWRVRLKVRACTRERKATL